MAFTPTSQLQSNPYYNLRDQQHAARLFTDDQFRLAPKHQFLFHVAFGINQAALKNIDLVQRHRNEINMLVKSCDLPKFTITAETLNQYNRKKVVQTTHKYEPINIKFHDDNMGLINQLWQNYYSYYYADPTAAQDNGNYGRNALKSSSYIRSSYGLDNRSTVPFFNYIKIYQMARHEYVCYTLQNPLITSWTSGAGKYAGNDVNEMSMALSYEAVAYSSGSVSQGTPEGFGVEHYDQTPSPLQGFTNPDSASPSFVNSGNITGNAAEFLDTITQQINTYQNTQNLSNPGTPGVISNLAAASAPAVNGIPGIAFPGAKTTTTTTVAAKVKLTIEAGVVISQTTTTG